VRSVAFVCTKEIHCRTCQIVLILHMCFFKKCEMSLELLFVE